MDTENLAFMAIVNVPENQILDKLMDTHYADDIARVDAQALMKMQREESSNLQGWQGTLNEEPPDDPYVTS